MRPWSAEPIGASGHATTASTGRTHDRKQPDHARRQLFSCEPGAIHTWRLLVDREHDRMLGRVDVQADDVLELGGEVGIVRALEGADAVRLQVVRRPDPLHRAQGDARVSWPSPGRSSGSPRRAARRRSAPPPGARLASPKGALPGLRVASRNSPSTPASANRRCQRHTAGRPTPARRATSATAQPLGRAEHDPRPRHVLLGAVAIGHDRLETSTILSRDHGQTI